MQIRDVMTSSVVTASPRASVQAVAELMRERNVGSVVLVEDGAIAGIVTDRDLAISVLADGRSPSDQAIDHASQQVVTGEPEMGVEAAGKQMLEHGVRRLPIIEAGRLLGIVTLDDLVARTGHTELTQALTTQITRAAMPEFYFLERGG